MGNQLAAPARVQPGELLASDVPTLVYKDSLGGGRFLKTFLTRAEEGTRGGLVVVKAYLKRGAPGSGGGLDADEVRAHAARLRETREALSRPPQRHLHAWPFQRELETERALYLMRQYAHATLHDRVSTRPFLTAIEKRWFAFQLLHALAECHARGVTHGDIKCENVLVTSWGWAFLSDFATFKPAALPADNPADYSYFFDTGGRRRCYVAPERFVDEPGPGSGGVNTTANAAGNVARDGRRSETPSSSRPSKSDAVTPAADVFSLGCALGELFLDGSALFDLSQLLAYRRGEHDPSAQLAGVRDEAMRELVLHMIARDPAERLSAAEYLERWRARGAFPKYFDVAHDVSATLLTEDADQTARSVARNFDRILAAVVAEEWEGAAEHAASAETAEARSGGRAGAEGLGRGEEAPPVGDAPLGGLSIASRRSASSDVDDELGSDGSAGSEVDVGRAMEDIDAMMRDIGNLLGDRAPDRGDDEEDGEALLWRGDEGGVSDASGASATDGGVGGSLDDVVPLEGDADDAFDFGDEKVGGEGAASRSALLSAAARAGARCPGAVLAASLACSCARSASLASARRRCLRLLSRAASVADDDARLQLAVPYCVALAADPSALVRAAAVRALAEILPAVESFPASDAKVFPEFVWPSLGGLARDAEESVRVAYADSLATLAKSSARILQRVVAGEARRDASDEKDRFHPNKDPNKKDPPNAASKDLGSGAGNAAGVSMSAYEEDLASLRAVVRAAVLDYLTPEGGGPEGGSEPESTSGAAGSTPTEPFRFGFGGRSAPPIDRAATPIARPRRATRGSVGGPATRAALLSGAEDLARFFGRAEANDFLVPFLITCLNDRHWSLRAAFFEVIPAVGRLVGEAPCEAFLLPCAERCLADARDEVVAAALRCLGEMIEPTDATDATEPALSTEPELSTDASFSGLRSSRSRSLLRKRSIVASARRAAPALCHPAGAVRLAASRFFAAATRRLGRADAYALLLPALAPFLDPAALDTLGAAFVDVMSDAEALSAAARRPPTREAFDDAVEKAGERLAREAEKARERRRASRGASRGSSLGRDADFERQSVIPSGDRLEDEDQTETETRRSDGAAVSVSRERERGVSSSGAETTPTPPAGTDPNPLVGASGDERTLSKPSSNLSPFSAAERAAALEARAGDDAALFAVATVREERRAEEAATLDALGEYARALAQARGVRGGGGSREKHKHSAEMNAQHSARASALALVAGGVAEAAIGPGVVAGSFGGSEVHRFNPASVHAPLPPGGGDPLAASPGSLNRRAKQEGSMNPLEGMLSPLARRGSAEPNPAGVTTAARGIPVVGVSSSGGGSSFAALSTFDAADADAAARTDAASAYFERDREAWASAFGPRAPPLVPPDAPLVRRADADRLARAGPSSAFGASLGGSLGSGEWGFGGGAGRRRSGDLGSRSGGFGANDDAERAPRSAPDAARAGFSAGVRGGTSHGDTLKRAPDGGFHPDGYGDARSSDGPEKGPGAAEKASETVADAFSAAMAKGLDLVSGKAATASSAGSGADAEAASRVGGFGDGGGTLYASGRSGDPWAPRGVLVAHLAEHAAPVRALTSSADGLFFVSGGDDGACKLWDCARLERDVSFRSRLTYASQGGRITALCAGVTGDDHAVASASDQGAVHVWRVEYVERKKTGAPVSNGDRGGEDAAPGGFGDSAGVRPAGGNATPSSSFPRNKNKPPSVERYTGAAEIRQRADGDGAVLCLERVSPNVLCFATARGGFRGWDLRAPGARDAFRVTLPPRLGVATRCASEPHSFFSRDGDGSHPSSAAGSTPRWFVFGTSAGCVALADARFGAVAAEWRLPGGASHAVEALALDPTRARDRTPLAWVAHGPDEVALWDVARGELRAAAEVAGRRGRRRGEDAEERDADERAGGDEEGAWELATFSFAHNGGILEPWVHASAFDWASTTDHAFASPENENGEGEDAARTPPSREATKKSTRAAETRLELDFRVAELGDAPANVGGAKCVLPLPSGAVLTGGADACVRLWCPGDANRGRVVHGPLPPGAGRAPRHEERAVTVGGRVARVMREPRNAAGNAPGVAEAKANAAARHDCHRDAVLAMEAVGVGTGRALVTAGRDAAVKVWK